jgi:hypothetical protein
MPRSLVVLLIASLASVATGQIREWDGFNGLWDSAFNWTPADVPDTTAETAFLGAGGSYTVTLDTGSTTTIGRLIFTNPSGTLAIEPFSRLIIDQSGGMLASVVNEGRIALGSETIRRGQLEFVAPALGSLLISSNNATGQIDLDQAADIAVTVPMLRTAGFRVSQGQGHTIRGNGRIDLDGDEFVNNGVIIADDDGEALRIFTAPGSVLINNSDMIAGGEATLEINGEVDQTGGGFVFAEDDAVLRLAGSIRGGDIATADDSTAETAGRLTLDTVEIDADLLVTHELTLTGNALVNDGAIVRAVGGSDPADSEIVVEWPHVIIGNGTIEMAPGTTLRTQNNDPQPITHGPDHTIFGGGFIESALVNEGTIRAGFQTLGGNLILSENAKTNNARIEANAGSSVLVDSIDITQGKDGVLDAGLGNLLFIGFGPSRVEGGAILSDPVTGVVEVASAIGTPVLVTMNDLLLNARTRVRGRLITESGFKNDGSIDLVSGIADPPAELLFDGRAEIDGDGFVRVLAAGGGLIRSLPGGFGRFGPAQTVTGSPSFEGTFFIDGTLELPIVTDTADVEGDLTFSSTAALGVTLNAASGTSSRITRAAGAGTVKIEGELRITLTDPTEPVPDTPFTIIEPGGSVAGTFDTVTVTNAPPGFPGFDIVYQPDRVSIQLLATPCNTADLAEPFGDLTFADISAFLTAFTAQDPAADLAAPQGQFTFADISAFLAAFAAGCP